MLRRDLVRLVQANLPKASDSVSYPDHPLLLTGPDVLAATNGALTAYFVSTSRSSQSTPRALANVVLSRFALPKGTAFVLVQDEAESAVVEEKHFLFDRVVAIGRRGRTALPSGRISGRSDVWDAVEELRQPHHDRFSEAWALTSDRQRRPSRPTPGRSTAEYGIQRGLFRPRGRYTDFDGEHIIVGSPRRESRGSLTQRLKEASTTAARLDYCLDAGVEGLGQVQANMRTLDLHLALHYNHLPAVPATRAFDVLKPIRAAAFAGFATTLEDQSVII